ncbi:MAG: DNA polymerase III subunit gamma/tau [Thermoflexibacteraceae bacterium]
MENFIVSARKYRPATFDTVVGQSHITTTLKNAILNNHLAQAFLFCGPRGVGKTTCARILAKTINCTNLTPEGEACDQCESCVAFKRNASMNISELDAASNNSVDDIRNLIEQVRIPPQMGIRKVYIIDEVHMLTTSAFNAFLKTLEEPPSYAIFILATTEKHKILPTILSRCQIFDFNRIRIADIANHLDKIAKNENIEAEAEALRLIAQKADGGLRDALSMFDLMVTFSGKELTYKKVVENLHVLDYEYYFNVTDAFLQENLSQALLIFDEILKKGFDGHNFLIGLCEHLRNLLVCKDAVTIQLLEVSENVQRRYQEQAQKASAGFIMSALNITNQAELSYKNSKQQRLLVEITLMKLANLQRAIDLPNVLEELKKKTNVTTTPTINTVATTTKTAENNAGNVDNGLKSTPKINQQAIVQQQAVQNTKVEENKEPITYHNNNVAKEIDVAALQHHWTEFVEATFKDKKQLVYTNFSAYPFTVKGNNIELPVANLVTMEGLLKEGKEQLLAYLRKNLNNNLIQLQFIKATITDEQPTKRYFTPTDKFKKLVEKYPLLNELRQNLGLDLDI